MEESIPPGNFSPYTLETRAHWVPNPAGEPKYYLQLDERFTHVANEKIGTFGYDFADYMPREFGVRAISPENCPSPSPPPTISGAAGIGTQHEPRAWRWPCRVTIFRGSRSAAFSTAIMAGAIAIFTSGPKTRSTESSPKLWSGTSCRVHGKTPCDSPDSSRVDGYPSGHQPGQVPSPGLDG